MGHARFICYSEKELTWIRINAGAVRREAHATFCRRFHRTDVSYQNYVGLCKRKGWLTGRTGHYVAGQAPANKGKKMPYNAHSAATQFKKGSRSGRANLQYKPIGTERISISGYTERKINDDLPLQSRWRAVHLLNWEEVNGPLPKAHCLKCLDGNKQNTAPDNWECIARSVLQMLNHRTRKLNYDELGPEEKTAALTIAKIRSTIGKKRSRG